MWNVLSGWPPANERRKAATVMPTPRFRSAIRRTPRRSSGKLAVESPTLQPRKKTMYVEKAHPTAPTRAGSGSRPRSRKKSHPQMSARKSVKAHVNVQERGTGRKTASHVAGWKTAAPALPRSGLPARMNRFHSGARPFAIDSRTAARHGAVDASLKDRLAGEDERQEKQEDRDPARDPRDEAARQRDRERRRGRVGQSERGSVEVQRSASKKFYSVPVGPPGLQGLFVTLVILIPSPSLSLSSRALRPPLSSRAKRGICVPLDCALSLRTDSARNLCPF